MKNSIAWALILTQIACVVPGYASSGTEGASFLDIPVGAGPAAMGSAYTALAKDAYSATWNPAGLGFLESTQFSGQHLSYLDSLHYEYLSAAVPLPRSKSCSSMDACPGSGLGASIQYLGSGDVNGTDELGNSIGQFSSHYASYNLSYGRTLTPKLALGLTGKMIRAQLDDVSASAFAADLGAMYKPNGRLTLAATATNIGTPLKFISQGDSLPLALHMGAAYQVDPRFLLTSEIVAPKTGLVSAHAGGEWRPVDMLAIRMGYRTDTVKELSSLAGYSAGVGLNVWGQEFAYAWLPYGDLGNTHYISLLMRFGEVERAKHNLIQYQHIKKHRTVDNAGPDSNPDYMQLMELLNAGDEHVARSPKLSGDQREIQ